MKIGEKTKAFVWRLIGFSMLSDFSIFHLRYDPNTAMRLYKETVQLIYFFTIQSYRSGPWNQMKFFLKNVNFIRTVSSNSLNIFFHRLNLEILNQNFLGKMQALTLYLSRPIGKLNIEIGYTCTAIIVPWSQYIINVLE